MILRRASASLAGRMAGLALTVLVILVRVAIAATLGRAQALFVQAPVLDATGAAQCAAGCTAGRTCHAFASLLVRAVTRRARGATRAYNTFVGDRLAKTNYCCNILTGYDVEYRLCQFKYFASFDAHIQKFNIHLRIIFDVI